MHYRLSARNDCSFPSTPSGDRSGLRRCETIRISIPARCLRLLCPLLTSPTRSGSITLPSAIAGTWEISRGKTQNFPCVDAGFIKHAPAWREGFAVTCQLAPGVPHLVSGFCSSPRIFGLGFLQTPPRDDALALLLSFGSAKTWYGDFHPISSVPCPAHTARMRREK